jgi:hypothetical protein
MAKCPMCGKILEDAWLKKVGATLMGKSSSPGKGYTRLTSQAAARKRWSKARKKELIT